MLAENREQRLSCCCADLARSAVNLPSPMLPTLSHPILRPVEQEPLDVNAVAEAIDWEKLAYAMTDAQLKRLTKIINERRTRVVS